MSRKIVYISDFFVNHILGGGELNDDELIKMLESANVCVEKYQSHLVNIEVLQDNIESLFVVSNFCNLSYQCREWMITNAKYVVYEHDHKYLSSRNPAIYKDFLAPQSEIRNYSFYREALQVITQSSFHKEILVKNLHLNNVISIAGNIWSVEALEHIRILSRDEKRDCCSILDSGTEHKNTIGAIKYCDSNKLEYERISDQDYKTFLYKLSRNKTFVFLPKTPETLSRIVVESRMLGMSVRTNSLVGATGESWFKLKGEELIDYMIDKRQEILNVILELIKINKPKQDKEISIVSTFYKGEKFLEGFLENMTEQTIFEKCELILIDSASPGREREIIEAYTKKHDNIKYYRIDELLKPTPCFNMAIQKARGKYITFGFIDDRKSKNCLEILYDEITKSNVDLVYGDVAQTSVENERFEDNNLDSLFEHSRYSFSKENMVKCLPGPMPLWRSSIHDKCGFFDNEQCDFADDWDMWLRAVDSGSVFKKIDKTIGLYLVGGRSQQDNNIAQKREEARLFFKYRHLFGQNFHKFRPYFQQFF